MADNIDIRTVQGFGDEWSRFDQARLNQDELAAHFNAYFRVFPWTLLPDEAEGFDLGCGSGRWAALVSKRVGRLHCIDASPEALAVAKTNLADRPNAFFHHASVDDMPFEDNSMDFGYSLGVLHHIPDTARGIAACVSKLRAGAPFLIYLYYAFDNRPRWFRTLWRISDFFRRIISSLPFAVKKLITDLLALLVYFPFAKLSALLETIGMDVDVLPLSTYRNYSFYTMRTDALDRFGTRLERRFTRAEIEQMMASAGLTDIIFSSHTPYWCAVGIKR